RPRVTRELDVTAPRDRRAALGAGYPYAPLPVHHASDRSGRQLLVVHRRRHRHVDALARYPDAPAVRIVGTRVRALPVARRLDRERRARQIGPVPVARDPGAARQRFDRAVAAPQLIEHQLLAAVELQAEPIPAHLARIELAGAELWVHPRQAMDRERVGADLHGAGGLEAGER